MAFPLAALAIPAAIQVGGSLLSSYLNKPSKAERDMLSGVAEGKGIENEILRMRQEMLAGMQGRTEDFKKAILNKKGKPLVMRLPGVGGVSDEQWAKSLQTAMGAIDFGGKREWEAEMQLLTQMNPLGNSSGAAAGLASSMQGQRADATAGTAGFLADLGQSIYNGIGQGPAQVDLPQLSPGIAPIPSGSILDGMLPPTLPGGMGGQALPLGNAGVNLLPTGPSLEGGF